MTLNIAREDLEKYYLKQRLSSRKIAKIYKCAYSTIDRKVKGFGLATRTLANAHIIYKRRDFSGNMAEKAYLLGFCIGDLRVRKVYKNSETIHVDCGSTKKEQIELISKLFNQYGRVWISKPSKLNKTQIECFLNNSFKFLLEVNPNIIESWIISKKTYFANFLAGFTDAEGSIFITAGKASYALGNYNRKLLLQIKKYLQQFGIDSRDIVRSIRKGLIASHGYRYNQDYWTLAIGKKTELLKLFKFMGPYLRHTNRINQMEIAINNIKLRNKLYGK